MDNKKYPWHDMGGTLRPKRNPAVGDICPFSSPSLSISLLPPHLDLPFQFFHFSLHITCILLIPFQSQSIYYHNDPMFFPCFCSSSIYILISEDLELVLVFLDLGTYIIYSFLCPVRYLKISQFHCLYRWIVSHSVCVHVYYIFLTH